MSVTVTRVGRVALLEMSSAPANALSEAMLARLEEALLESADSACLVVCSGLPRVFCAGHDLKELRGGACEPRRVFERCSRVMRMLEEGPPSVACVSGVATAAGLQLVAACDLAVAAEDARFAAPGVNIGLFCSTPAVPLVRSVSRKHAAELLLTGDTIDAGRAAAMGLVNRVVPREALRDSALELAQRVASKPRNVVRLGKRVLAEQRAASSTREAYEIAGKAMVANLLQYPESAEGIDAFLEKREPKWRD